MSHLTSIPIWTYRPAPPSSLLSPPSSPQRGRESRLAIHREIHRQSPPANRGQSQTASRRDSPRAGHVPIQPANRRKNHPARASANRSATGPDRARQNPGANRDPRGPPNHLPNRSRNGSQGDSRGVVSSHLQADGFDNVLWNNRLQRRIRRGRRFLSKSCSSGHTTIWRAVAAQRGRSGMTANSRDCHRFPLRKTVAVPRQMKKEKQWLTRISDGWTGRSRLTPARWRQYWMTCDRICSNTTSPQWRASARWKWRPGRRSTRQVYIPSCTSRTSTTLGSSTNSRVSKASQARPSRCQHKFCSTNGPPVAWTPPSSPASGPKSSTPLPRRRSPPDADNPLPFGERVWVRGNPAVSNSGAGFRPPLLLLTALC